MAKFKAGDKVKVKGIEGPPMIVQGVHGLASEHVMTFWFIGKKKESGNFHEDTLELSNE